MFVSNFFPGFDSVFLIELAYERPYFWYSQWIFYYTLIVQCG